MKDRRTVLKMMSGAVIGLPVLSGTRLAAQPATNILKIVTPELDMLTGAFNSSGAIYQISAKMFDGLVGYDFNFDMVPELALKWDVSDGGKSVTFHLRPGVKWHDGKPFTSADVQWSAMNVWKKLHPRGRTTFNQLEAVETPDELTAIFRLRSPTPYMMKALHAVESQILPRHLYENTDILTNPHNVAPVGTGPFRFREWKRGDYVLLDRNEHYWKQGKPTIDRIVIRTIPDNAARASGLEAQELDIGAGMPVTLSDARRLEKLPFLSIPPRGGEAIANQCWIEFNLQRPRFQDVRVRRAIAHALNKEFMLKAVWFNFGTVSTGPISRALSEFYTDKVTTYEFNIEKANRLLDEAGMPRGKDGIRFSMTHDPLPLQNYFFRAGEYFRQAMARVGIAVELRTQDFGTWARRVYTDRDFDTTLSSAHNLTDPSIGVQRFFWSKSIAKGVPFSNGSGYSNAEVDKLLEAAQTEMDRAKRASLFHRFQQVVAEDLPQIPLIDTQWFTIQNRRLRNVELSPYGPQDNFSEVVMG